MGCHDVQLGRCSLCLLGHLGLQSGFVQLGPHQLLAGLASVFVVQLGLLHVGFQVGLCMVQLGFPYYCSSQGLQG